VWHERFRYLKADPKDVDLVPGFTRDVTGLVSDYCKSARAAGDAVSTGV
jgi:hypothetical protein